MRRQQNQAILASSAILACASSYYFDSNQHQGQMLQPAPMRRPPYPLDVFLI